MTILILIYSTAAVQPRCRPECPSNSLGNLKSSRDDRSCGFVNMTLESCPCRCYGNCYLRELAGSSVEMSVTEPHLSAYSFAVSLSLCVRHCHLRQASVEAESN